MTQTVCTLRYLTVIFGLILGPFSHAEEKLLLRQDVDGTTVCEDTYLYRDDPGQNFNQGLAQPYLYVRQAGDKSQGLVRVSLLRWHIPSAPLENRQITSAKVTLYVDNTKPYRQRIGLFPLRRAWNATAASWNQATSSASWEKPGAQGEVDADSAPVAEAETSPEAGYPVEFSLPVDLVKKWAANPSSNQGLLAKFTDDYYDLSAEFYSSESPAGKQEMRPSLELSLKYAENHVIFEDNFNDIQESTRHWILKDGSNWTIQNHAIILDPNSKVQLRDSEKWDNITFSCKLKILETNGQNNAQLGVMVGGCHIFIGEAEDRFLYTNPTTLIGKKIDLGNKGGWHTLKVVYKTDHMVIYFDGEEAVVSPLPPTHEPISLRAINVKGAFSEVRVVQNGEDEKRSPNVVLNSGFEKNTDSTLPDFWGNCQAGLFYVEWIAKRKELFQRWKSDVDRPFEGERCMRVDGLASLYSTMWGLRATERYTLSAYLRSEKEDLEVEMIFVDWTTPTQTRYLTKKVRLTKEWQRYVLPLGAIEGSKGFCGFDRTGNQEGAFWVDAVQLEAGDMASAYQPATADLQTENPPDLPEVAAGRLTEAPVIDGSLGDVAWLKATQTEMSTTEGVVPRQKTECFLAYDQANLYIGFRCHDSQMDNVRAEIETRDGSVWLDDAVEIFLNPSNRENYYHLGVSVTGARYDALKSKASWNADWQAKTKRFADRWECEIRIPFDSLDLTTFDRGDWKLNLCRDNAKIQEWSAWSPTFNGGFHNERYFGRLKAFPSDITAGWVQESPGTVYSDDLEPFALSYKGKPLLGYGLYWSQSSLQLYPVDENVFKAMREASMNVIFCTLQPIDYTPTLHQKENLVRMLELADSYGIGVVICFWYTAQPEIENVQVVKSVIAELKDAKGIIAWNVMDEPHENPEIVKQVVQAAKDTDPTRPAFINLTPQGVGMKIAGVPGDVVCADRYPIGFDGSNIADVGTLAREQMQIASPRKIPAWQILQNMSNWLWVERVITPEEFSAQTYEGLVKGVTGVFYFAGFPLAQKTWERQVEVGAELRRLEPILLSQKFGKVSSNSPKISYVCKTWNEDHYLIAVNPHYEIVSSEFDLSELAGGDARRVEDFFTATAIPAPGGKISLTLKPLERVVYKITTTAQPRPAAPLGLTAAPGDGKVELSWSAASGATNYLVKVGLNHGGPYSVQSSVTQTTFTDDNLVNGTTYYYVVSAQNVAGSSPDSNEASATPSPAPSSLQLVGAVSRKTHGSAGAFDVNLPLSGSVGVEGRSSGLAGHTLVLTFNKNILAGRAPVVRVTGGQVNGECAISGATVTIPLTGVANASRCTVTLSDLTASDGGPGYSGGVSFDALEADVNGNRSVNVADAAMVRAQSGQPVTVLNFRSDINANGVINVADTAIQRDRSGSNFH